MNRFSFLLVAFIATPVVTAFGQDFTVTRLEAMQPRIEGAQCEFSDKNGVILKADWVNKAWMKIDGKLVEFSGTRTDSDKYSDLEKKRWRETFYANDLTAVLDLKQTGLGEDGAAFKGSIAIQRGEIEMRFVVHGGCGA